MYFSDQRIPLQIMWFPFQYQFYFYWIFSKLLFLYRIQYHSWDYLLYKIYYLRNCDRCHINYGGGLFVIHSITVNLDVAYIKALVTLRESSISKSQWHPRIFLTQYYLIKFLIFLTDLQRKMALIKTRKC